MTIYRATAPSGDTVTITVEEGERAPHNAVLNLDRAGTILDTIWIYDDGEIEDAFSRYDQRPTAIPVRVEVESFDNISYIDEINDIYHVYHS